MLVKILGALGLLLLLRELVAFMQAAADQLVKADLARQQADRAAVVQVMPTAQVQQERPTQDQVVAVVLITELQESVAQADLEL